MPNYSRKCAALQQALMDRLEQQGVHPHNHDVQVKLISPSWVLQKGSAKNIKLQDCTLEQLRYVVAFNALNDHLLPQPAKPSSAIKALKFLAHWKYHIFADLQNSYFQIHVTKKDWCWMGVMTPFTGVQTLLERARASSIQRQNLTNYSNGSLATTSLQASVRLPGIPYKKVATQSTRPLTTGNSSSPPY